MTKKFKGPYDPYQIEEQKCNHLNYRVVGDIDDKHSYIWQMRNCNECGRIWAVNYKMSEYYKKDFLDDRERENLK